MLGINSNRLREKRQEIIALWEERSLKEVPSAVTAESLALRDSLPIYLNHLSDALATNRKMDVTSVLAHNTEAIRIGKLLGADNTSYVLTEVIFEYHILREVIFQVLEVEGPLDPPQRDIIYDSIEKAVNDAAVKFSEVHSAIQQKFIDTLTHDLKTPLTSAKIGAQIILRRSDKPEACIKSAKNIISSLNRLESMIHDLLDASRVRAGETLSLPFVQCDLEAVIHEVVNEMSIIYGNRFTVDSKEAIEGKWSSDGLRRATENLIGNAVKYGDSQTPITISLRPGKTNVELAVHNHGPTIPEQDVPILFEHYGRSKSGAQSTQVGWGLGLTLVRGVVDAHKGQIRVESAEGKGTSFILQLPYAKDPALDRTNCAQIPVFSHSP